MLNDSGIQRTYPYWIWKVLVGLCKVKVGPPFSGFLLINTNNNNNNRISVSPFAGTRGATRKLIYQLIKINFAEGKKPVGEKEIFSLWRGEFFRDSSGPAGSPGGQASGENASGLRMEHDWIERETRDRNGVF
jgi:hypothetical protein